MGPLYYIILYYIILYYIILYYIILYYIILYYIILYYIILYYIILYYIILYYIILHCIVLYRIVSHIVSYRIVSYHIIQDCFLQKDSRVCVSDAIVVEDSKFKSCFFCCGRWASDRGSRCANVNIVVEWKGILAEGTVVWNDYENNIVKTIKCFLNCTESSICSVLLMLA